MKITSFTLKPLGFPGCLPLLTPRSLFLPSFPQSVTPFLPPPVTYPLLLPFFSPLLYDSIALLMQIIINVIPILNLKQINLFYEKDMINFLN